MHERDLEKWHSLLREHGWESEYAGKEEDRSLLREGPLAAGFSKSDSWTWSHPQHPDITLTTHLFQNLHVGCFAKVKGKDWEIHDFVDLQDSLVDFAKM
jgi:hypothetical protein